MNNDSKTKQVIIVRKDLNLSPGKIGAQVAHASLSAVFNKNTSEDENQIHIPINEEEKEWFTKRFTKVVLSIKNEKDLLDLHQKALKAGLNVSRPIVDAGFTELEKPTLTCIAIGPNFKEKIDEVCGHLQTYKMSAKDKRIMKFLKKELIQAEEDNDKSRINLLKELM